MQHTIRVNFNNMSLNQSAKQRMDEILKPLYWNVENFDLPADWAGFDGEIEVEGLQDRGGDYVAVTAEKSVIQSLLNHFKKSGEFRELRSIEIPASTDALQDFKQHIDPQVGAEFEEYKNIETFKLRTYTNN